MAYGTGFGGGLASGLTAGINAGSKLKSGWDAKQTNDLRKKELADAKKEYDAQVSEDVMQQAGQHAQTGIDKPFDANAANAQAKKKVGSFTDFLYNQRMPQIVDSLVASGDVAGAEAMRKWAEDGKERSFMDKFGKVLGTWQSGQASGDYNAFAKGSVDLLNSGNYGITATGYDLVKDGDGKTTGLTFNLKNADGNEFSHTFNSLNEAAQFVAAQGSPQNRVKQWMTEQESAAKLKSTIATKKVEAQFGIMKDNATEDNKQQNRERLEGIKQDNRLQIKASEGKDGALKEQQKDKYVIDTLKTMGFGDDDVAAYVANKYLGGYRKGKSPQEFAQQIVIELAKDPMNQGKKPEEIEAQARALVDLSNKLGNSGAPQQRTAPAAPAPQRVPPVFR